MRKKPTVNDRIYVKATVEPDICQKCGAITKVFLDRYYEPGFHDSYCHKCGVARYHIANTYKSGNKSFRLVH